MTTVTITATMDEEQAEQLAQFCKRCHSGTFYGLTEAHLPPVERDRRAILMFEGLTAVQRGLAEAGFAPR